MNEQTIKLLEGLADKLGTTTEYLWVTMVNQAHISAMNDILMCSIFIFFIGFGWWFINKQRSRKGNISLFEIWGNDDHEGLQYIIVIHGAFTALTSICIFGAIGDIITKLSNPEYWALMRILEKI